MRRRLYPRACNAAPRRTPCWCSPTTSVTPPAPPSASPRAPRTLAGLGPGTTPIRGREPHTSRRLDVALDPHLTPQRPPDQLDQLVEPHARPAADVDRLGQPRRPRPGGPFPGGEDAVHAIRNIGIVALARPVPVHPDRLSTGDEVGEAMDREVGPLARPVHREEPEASDLHAVEMRERVRHQLPGALAGGVG